jgi:hypothetical protein
MTEQLTLAHDIARRQAERGMRRALDRAADGMPTWPELALSFLESYARANECFAGWMVVRSAGGSTDFPAPPNDKAWGMVFRRAARAQIIAAAGITRDPHRHHNPVPLWRSLVFEGGARSID